MSHLNYSGGTPAANLVTVRVGAGGKVVLYNGGPQPVDLFADVAGYYAAGAPTVPGAFVALDPARLLDTRADGSAIGPATARRVPVAGRAGVPASGVSAVVLNLTTVNATATGYVTAYPNTAARPLVASVSYVPARVAGNLVTVPVGSDGRVALYNSGTGAVDVVADVAGYYLGGTPTRPGAFVAVPSARVLDTPNGTGVGAPVGARRAGTVAVAGRGGVPGGGKAGAVVLNLTALTPTAAGYLAVYPNLVAPRPAVSNVSFAKGPSVSGLAVVRLGTDGRLGLLNASGQPLDLLGDVAGWFLR